MLERDFVVAHLGWELPQEGEHHTSLVLTVSRSLTGLETDREYL